MDFRASIGNFGDVFSGPNAVMGRVSIFYENIVTFFLAPGETAIVNFGTWICSPGIYVFKCSLLMNDDNPANNVRTETFSCPAI